MWGGVSSGAPPPVAYFWSQEVAGGLLVPKWGAGGITHTLHYGCGHTHTVMCTLLAYNSKMVSHHC